MTALSAGHHHPWTIGRFPMPQADIGTSSNWWVALATIGGTMIGAILMTFRDLVFRRDSANESWRKDLIAEMQALRQWNGHQQEQLNQNVTRMETLEKSVHDERDLRHEIRGQLNSKVLELEILKHDYAAVQVEYAKLRCLYEASCAAAGHQPEPAITILPKHLESAIPPSPEKP